MLGDGVLEAADERGFALRLVKPLHQPAAPAMGLRMADPLPEDCDTTFHIHPVPRLLVAARRGSPVWGMVAGDCLQRLPVDLRWQRS